MYYRRFNMFYIGIHFEVCTRENSRDVDYRFQRWYESSIYRAANLILLIRQAKLVVCVTYGDTEIASDEAEISSDDSDSFVAYMLIADLSHYCVYTII